MYEGDSSNSPMRASGLIYEGEYAEDEIDPNLSHLKLPVHVVFHGSDNSPLPIYGVYPDW